jgi:hypothetical protein
MDIVYIYLLLWKVQEAIKSSDQNNKTLIHSPLNAERIQFCVYADFILH